MLLCLIGQSALGCTALHANICADDGGADTAQQDLPAPAPDPHDCEVACAHCHGGCVHTALAAPTVEMPGMAVANTPDVRVTQRPVDSAQHPLLRPPADPA